MPISFKSAADPSQILKHLGIYEHLFDNYVLDLGISELRIYEADSSPKPEQVLLATVKPGTLLSSVLKMEPPHTTYQVFRQLLLKVSSILMNSPNEVLGVCDANWLKSNSTTVVEDAKFVVEALESETPQKVPNPFTFPVDPAAIKAIEEVLDEVDIKLLLKKPVVPLRDATQLYQPVRGTSLDARYYVIGISKDGIKVAMKKPKEGMSLRVEYEDKIPNSVIAALTHFGIHPKGEYLSGHFNLSHSTPTRFVGALLMDMGVEWATQLPNVKLLELAP
jgi:hypothetical protein